MRGNLDGKPLTVRLRAEEVEAIERIAAQEDREVSWLHRRLIREALSARGVVLGDDRQKEPVHHRSERRRGRN